MFNNSRLELLDASFSMASKEYAFRTIQQDLLQNFDVSKDFAKYHTGKLLGLVFGKKPKLTVKISFPPPTRPRPKTIWRVQGLPSKTNLSPLAPQ